MNSILSLKVVVAIADQGTFSAAARELGLTPAAVAKRVDGLYEL